MGISMKRTLICDANKHLGQEITIKGFVQVVRNQKAVQFIVLRDHTGLIQIVVERSPTSMQVNKIVDSLQRESTIDVTGFVVANPKVKLGQIEILLKDIVVSSIADEILPIDISGRTTTEVDKRFDWRFLDLRRSENQLIFQVQTTIEAAMREFWLSEGFIEIHSPKLMGSPSEGGAELFTVDYFGQTAALAQSPQFYKQMAMAAGLDRVFEIGPVFRADPSFTSRHATEFTSVDMEMSWIDSHHDIMEMEERWLQYIFSHVKNKYGEEIKKAFSVDVIIPEIPFPKYTMAEAQDLILSQGHIPPVDTKKGDLDPQGEKILCDYVRSKFDHEFVFVTDYPVEVRPFYHQRQPNESGLTKSFDLLWKWYEITTGAQREHRYDLLIEQAEEKKINVDSIRFYLDFFKYGCPPHGGFGFGLARLIAALLNINSIREVTYLHRSPNRLIP
jgi:nondiscriminating aspartyl-tRNA synthetase